MKRNIDYLREWITDLTETLDALEASRPRLMDAEQLKNHLRFIEDIEYTLDQIVKETKGVQIDAVSDVISRETELFGENDWLSRAGRFHEQLTKELEELEKNGLI